MYRLGRPTPEAPQEGAAAKAERGRLPRARPEPGAAPAEHRAGLTGTGRGERRRGHADYLGVLRAPAPLRASSRPLLQRLLLRWGKARLRKKGSAAGATEWPACRAPGSTWGRSPPSQPQRTWPPGLQAAGKGAGARAQGLYVNGDSGGGRGEGSGAAGRARSARVAGPGSQE